MSEISTSLFKRFTALQPFNDNIKHICVFGEDTRSVIFVTNDDNVFAFGVNQNGCLGLGDNSAQYVINPMKVEILCNKNVNKIIANKSFSSEAHVFAMTSDSNVYSWGENSYGQLADGTTNTSYVPK